MNILNLDTVRRYVRLVDELRRMHTVYSRPWNAAQRREVEKVEKEVDELTADFMRSDDFNSIDDSPPLPK